MINKVFAISNTLLLSNIFEGSSKSKYNFGSTSLNIKNRDAKIIANKIAIKNIEKAIRLNSAYLFKPI